MRFNRGNFFEPPSYELTRDDERELDLLMKEKAEAAFDASAPQVRDWLLEECPVHKLVEVVFYAIFYDRTGAGLNLKDAVATLRQHYVNEQVGMYEEAAWDEFRDRHEEKNTEV